MNKRKLRKACSLVLEARGWTNELHSTYHGIMKTSSFWAIEILDPKSPWKDNNPKTYTKILTIYKTL